MKNLIVIFVLLGLSVQASAGDLAFSNITQAEMENIVNDFSANFAPTTVSSAAALGKLFGIELGVIGGATKTPNIQAYAQRSSAPDAPAALPHVGVFGALSIPFGLTVEAGGVPNIRAPGGELHYAFGGLKWTFWDTLVDVAAKANIAKIGFSFSQNSNGVTGTVEFTDTVETYVLMVSKNFVVIEPYLGFGTIKTDGRLKVIGTGTIFDTTYTTAQEATQNPSGSYSVVGLNFNLFILKIGAEFYKALNTDGATAKVSFYF